ncbi:MAG: phosphate/phosphite/phosphonate ABC transporter substrate-binding protein [Acidiferrobacterales bacterium]
MRLSISRFIWALVLLFSSQVLAEELVQTSNGPVFRKTTSVYTFGVVPQYHNRKIIRIWRPILNEIEKQTGIVLSLTGTPTIPAFEKKFMKGELDFAYMNPYHILKASDSQGYIPLVRDGSRKLRGILVVLKDSPYKSAAELNGQVVALPSPNALGASMLLRADLESTFGMQVKPKYVQTHSSVYLHVAKGLVVAGGGVMSTFMSQRPEIKNRLRILFTTRGTIPHPIVAHPRVPRQDIKKIKAALLAMGKTPEGKAMLAEIPINDIRPSSISEYKALAGWGLDKYYIQKKTTSAN